MMLPSNKFVVKVFFLICSSCIARTQTKTSCSKNPKLLYTYGDALKDSADCLGPTGEAYPHEEVAKFVRRKEGRTGRNLQNDLLTPLETQENLLRAHRLSKEGNIKDIHTIGREKRAANGTGSVSGASCVVGGAPPRLCRSQYNTTAPMYGVSLTSGQPVTIVQKFPDLLQQVIYETCDSKECDILHGECIQTYVPYLFLVIPLGPVTLTGQDYVLVESGCTCRPKYATPGSDPNPSDVIPSFS